MRRMLFGAAILRDAAEPVIGLRCARTRWRPLRMTVRYNVSDSNFKQPHFRVLAAHCARVLLILAALDKEGAGNAGCPKHPWPRV